MAKIPSPVVAPRACQPRPPAIIKPGAIAVTGAVGVPPYSDEYTFMPPTEVPSTAFTQTNPTEPVTAHLVRDTEHDFEVLQNQLREQGEQLQQIQRGRQNVAVGHAIDEEAQDHSPSTGGPDKGGGDEATSLMMPKRKWFVAAGTMVLAIVGIVVGVMLSTKPSPTPVPSPTLVNTTTPTSVTLSTEPSPTPAPQALIDLLSFISWDAGAALQTPSTPQNNAYKWLDGNANLDSYSDEKKIQRYVLATFYYSTNGDRWKNNAGWLSDDDECTWWNGADETWCTADGAVLELDLYDGSTESGNNLVGTIPVELALLSNSLNELSLGDNSLIGTIPRQIGFLSSLYGLYLWGNSLTGTIPTELALLINLQELSLDGNSLTGTIPDQIGSLTALEILYLWNNRLTGTIPSAIELLASLNKLSLSQNSLRGTILSEIGTLSYLEILNLWDNSLTGTIPSAIGLLSNLKDELSLAKNSLRGTIPSNIGTLSFLEKLYLWGNILTGTIPSQIGSLSSLTTLELAGNSLRGTVPSAIGLLTNLIRLDLLDNVFSGEFTCPAFITECFVSCYDATNVSCRSL